MLTPGKIFIGASVRLTAHIYDLTDTDQDPGTVTCSVMAPDGTLTTYTYGTDTEIGRTDAGDYYCDVEPDQSGQWRYRWKGSDDVSSYKVVDEGSFRVQYSPIEERTTWGDYT